MSKRRVLVVIDMQNDFLTGPLGCMEPERVCNKVLKQLNSGKHDKVFATRDTHYADTYASTVEGKKLPVLHCVQSTDGWCIEKRIQEALDKLAASDEFKVSIINKETFGSLDLAYQIKNWAEENGVGQEDLIIDICGVFTDICVISNATLIKAAVPNATIRIISNACSCGSEKDQERALKSMEKMHMDILYPVTMQ